MQSKLLYLFFALTLPFSGFAFDDDEWTNKRDSIARSTETDSRHQDYYELGARHMRQERWNEAAKAFKEALRFDKKHVETHKLLAYCLVQLSDQYKREADDHYSIALQIDPINIEALDVQGRFFLGAGNIKNAYSNYRQLHRLQAPEARDLKQDLIRFINDTRQVAEELSD